MPLLLLFAITIFSTATEDDLEKRFGHDCLARWSIGDGTWFSPAKLNLSVKLNGFLIYGDCAPPHLGLFLVVVERVFTALDLHAGFLICVND